MPTNKRLAVEIIDPFLDHHPVDVRGMAKALDIDIEEEQLEADVSGKIERTWWGDYVITVNSAHSETRKRFTIAHEIAHYVLHRDLIGDGIVDNALYRSERIGDARERQANRYSASLLMPAAAVKRAWNDGATTARTLAAAFKVSEAVAEIRMRELGCIFWPRPASAQTDFLEPAPF